MIHCMLAKKKKMGTGALQEVATTLHCTYLSVFTWARPGKCTWQVKGAVLQYAYSAHNAVDES